MFRIEHNVGTGEIVEIELSAKEIAEIEKAAAQKQAIESAQNSAKAALLERLGLTDDEFKTLIS